MFRFLRHIDEIFFVELWNDDCGNPGAHRCQTFFFQPSNRQNKPPQSDFTSHSDVGANRSVAEKRGERGKHGDARRWSVFWHCAGRHVHVDVQLAKIFRVHAQLAVAAAKETQRGLDRFFHHFANVSGERDVAFAGITRRFDVQHFAALRSVSQACNHTGFACLELCFANVFCRAQHFRHELCRNRRALDFSPRNLRRDSTADGCDLALQLPHSSFVRVIVNDLAERVLLPFDLLGLESVFFQLPLHQVSFGDLEFLALGVTGD